MKLGMGTKKVSGGLGGGEFELGGERSSGRLWLRRGISDGTDLSASTNGRSQSRSMAAKVLSKELVLLRLRNKLLKLRLPLIWLGSS